MALQDLVTSISQQIPDPNNLAFSVPQLLAWISDAGDTLCATVPVVQDWYAIQAQTGMDIYQLPQHIQSVEQAWFDLTPLTRTAEIDDIFTTKITGRSWWFGPHSIHANPRLHVWPAPNRTGLTTTLLANITATDGAIPVDNVGVVTATSASGFKVFGFLQIDNEIILYRNLPGTGGPGPITNILRGQGGTIAAAHTAGAIITELNIMFKCTRLPNRVTATTDLLEVPRGLWPLLELYVLARVRSVEQDEQTAMMLRREFDQMVEKLAQKSQIKGLRQGIQVRALAPGWGGLFRGRTYIP